MRFFAIVQAAAKRDGKVFFFWSFEGNDIIDDRFDGGDMSGWLVPIAEAERFDAIWQTSTDDFPDDLFDTFCIARWSEDSDGNISIQFE